MTIEKISELKQTLETANKKIRDFAATEGKQAIGSAFKPIFENYPKLVQIVWTQFTPHFNDGDVCEFDVGEPAAYIEGDDLNEHPGEMEIPYRVYSEEDLVKYSWAKEHNDRYYALNCPKFRDDVYSIWRAIPKELMEAVFDDGVKVTITRENIEVEEYDHD